MLNNSALRYGGEVGQAALDDPNNTFAILLRLVGNRKEVLELGCASGYLSQILRQAGCRVTGFEIDPAAAALARPYLDQLIIGDLEREADLTRIMGRFDVILCADVLEHLASPEKVVRHVTGHLQPGGRLIMSVPNVAHWSARWGLLRGRWDLTPTGLMDHTHLRWFTDRTAHRLLENSGLRVVDLAASYVFPTHNRLTFWPALAAFLQRIHPPGIVRRLFGYQLIFSAVKKEKIETRKGGST